MINSSNSARDIFSNRLLRVSFFPLVPFSPLVPFFSLIASCCFLVSMAKKKATICEQTPFFLCSQEQEVSLMVFLCSNTSSSYESLSVTVATHSPSSSSSMEETLPFSKTSLPCFTKVLSTNLSKF